MADDIIRVKITEEIIRVRFSSAQGPQGPQGAIDPNSHIHADPKATTRVMTYVSEFKAYVVEDN